MHQKRKNLSEPTVNHNVTKAIRKAIKKKSELATKYCSKPTVENQRAFKKTKKFLG